MNLQQVTTFGASEADNDALLLDCFEDHEAYIRARSHEKFLIVGRKGSGKTAIFKKLVSERSYNHFCHGHSFSDYPWFHHDKQKKVGVPESECFRYSWEYVILISIAKILINDDAQPWSDESLEAMARLEQFICDTYGSKSPELNRIFSPETTLRLKPSLTAGWGPLKATISAEKIEIDHLPSVIYEVNDALLETVIRCLNPDNNYYICFDELDRGFNSADENYRNRLSGLLIAARDFNRRIRQSGKNMTAVVFLRDDILRYLKFEDKNKIIEDFSSVIEWDKPSVRNSLRGLMSKRLSKVLDLPEEGAWDSTFNEEQQMPGRQSKFQYILDRTFKRPRDAIKFCNEVLRTYQHNPERTDKFENADIAGARDEYSRYARKELVDEMQQHFPEHERSFDLLRVIGNIGFTLAKFQEAHASSVASRGEMPPSIEMLRQLYEFSVIAYLKVGGAGGGSEWVWKYEDTDAEYDDRATTFRVHPGLKEVLGLKQGRASVEGEITEASGLLEDV